MYLYEKYTHHQEDFFLISVMSLVVGYFIVLVYICRRRSAWDRPFSSAREEETGSLYEIAAEGTRAWIHHYKVYYQREATTDSLLH